jgi:peroxiredoxin
LLGRGPTDGWIDAYKNKQINIPKTQLGLSQNSQLSQKCAMRQENVLSKSLFLFTGKKILLLRVPNATSLPRGSWKSLGGE